MDSGQMKSVIEGLLFVAGDEGLSAKQLAEVLEHDAAFVKELVKDLQKDLKRTQRGIQIVELAGTFQLTTVPDHAPYFERLAHSPSRSSLSQAALETLAIVAYKQPITRVEIEEIRGVKAEKALQTLVSKDLIQEVDRADAPGRPILYGTTKAFLDYFALGSIDDLPETTLFEDDENLEEETRLLFEKLEGQQITFDELALGQESR
ncbi:SMC-Scp complex subunit ScpB [Paenibacillus mucilaginosus]|uniref:Segregation and condensation protein B n=3 Tax=Paenibacillus mucilaginosus TaxID=61624 RepID=H6NMH5_9BACL|nr:SMC-Scp complex subunit ScpB [Paenibacillus mucilaginosus]AEI41290.1 ScpB [Paenibacillus mucilaginosus KNP414]AFC29841.1 ScpB [Paenibacillus mucilaginosus 3016]AFH62025.1 segregation and condensation protein B [Paenibacillus mucilaginosus K02]MCG7211289.1 SMC-Scp complex subunit ScpB [Paenibacillus mucilaginosus]WDM30321.1 SMC-Scp complex subunit ScpB [Paenibacillus mucilaginosus]